MKKISQGQVTLSKRSQGIKNLKTEDSQSFLSKKSISSIQQKSPQTQMKTPTKTPGTPLMSSNAKSSLPQTPSGKENGKNQKAYQIRYPEILEKAVKRVFLNNTVKHSDAKEVFQSFNSDSQNNASAGYEMVGVPPQPLKESTIINYLSCMSGDQSIKSSQETANLDSLISNQEVSKFLKRWFASQEPQYMSHQSSTISLGINYLNKTTAHSPQRLVCEAWDQVPIAYFIRLIISEYPDVLEEHKLSQTTLNNLKLKLKEMVSDDDQPQYISLSKLQLKTKQMGLLGLLLSALKSAQTQNTQSNSLLSPSSKQSNMQTKEFSRFFRTPDVQNVTQLVQDYASQTLLQAEATLSHIFNEQMKKLVKKTRDVEKLLQTVQNKVNDNFDLFKHESITKQTIAILKEQIDSKDIELDQMKQKSKQQQEECLKLRDIIEQLRKQIQNQGHISLLNVEEISPFIVSPTQRRIETSIYTTQKKKKSQLQSPITDGPFQSQFEISEVQLASEMFAIQEIQRYEEYRFASILTTQDKGQVAFQHYQLIPLLKNIPGLNEFFLRTQHINFLVNYWIVGVFQSCQLEEENQAQSSLQNPGGTIRTSQALNSDLCFKGLTDLYQKSLFAIPNLTRDTDTLIIMKMFLKLSLILFNAKKLLNQDKIKNWYANQKSEDQQSRLIKCFTNSLIHLTQFQVEQYPWQKNHLDKTQMNPILGSQSNLNNLKKLIQSFKSQHPEIINTLQIVQMYYSSESAQECVQIMNKDLNEQDSKSFLDSDATNLIIFPFLQQLDQNTLPLLQGLLQFKCPGQFYYAQYIQQICKQQNVDTLVDLATQLFNKQGTIDTAVKVWEILGAMAKSIGLKHSNVHLSFIVRMYSQNPNYIQNSIIFSNIQIVQSSLTQS